MVDGVVRQGVVLSGGFRVVDATTLGCSDRRSNSVCEQHGVRSGLLDHAVGNVISEHVVC